MSLENKLRAAATIAAREAMLNERGRCLWCIDEVIRELKQKLAARVLTPIQLQSATMKLKIAEGAGMSIRRAIASGVRPPIVMSDVQGGVTGQPDPADSSPSEEG